MPPFWSTRPVAQSMMWDDLKEEVAKGTKPVRIGMAAGLARGYASGWKRVKKM